MIALVLTAAGVLLALSPYWPARIGGVFLLGAMYTHTVELQHQCLHHSAFLRPRLHRIIGIPLGIPLFVGYSHYRIRHLQHHRYLGTPQDSEFFGFDTRKPVTWGALFREMFNFGRILVVLGEVVRSIRGTWAYDLGEIPERRRREVMSEYRIMGLCLLAAVAASFAGFGEQVLLLWALPLLVAVPLHFIVELPEHILCDNSSTDVLRNTRTITGSRFSTWYTNGNNLHVEHHAAMSVPINRLPERHSMAREMAVHTHRGYPAFFRLIAQEAQRNRKAGRTAGAGQ
ncbi:fatty acid desaturase family protein [Streptomyces sp. H27-S2]|uniref:fatty acid desaturase family protein n=1 Tax=Streptomyces antarcticus TaxID=2996458 RepID=UPI002271DDC1|nr:fatty acid desaturase [Streptomyces sp. H27-S2]MCY0950420.1 fatty acid desaturase [Streptomyces sp. H27-S2]